MKKDIILHCVSCGAQLSGRQKKFCSRRCKNTYNNLSYQSYQAQQIRGRKRKRMLVEELGASCELCGYARNLAALEFHHIDPAARSFQLDLRSLSNRKWRYVLEEVKKCRLLCANCHAEVHNPDASFG